VSPIKKGEKKEKKVKKKILHPFDESYTPSRKQNESESPKTNTRKQDIKFCPSHKLPFKKYIELPRSVDANLRHSTLFRRSF